MNSCLFEYGTVFPIKNKFEVVVLAFYFDLVPAFYFKIKSLFLNLYTSPQEPYHYFNYLLSREVCTNLQIKRFPLMKL